MNADDFAVRLTELAPAKVVLLGCAYGDSEADEFIDSFSCRLRSEPLGIETNSDPMLDLLDRWDVSHVVIGPIGFHLQPKPVKSQLEIGTVEGDRLVRHSAAGNYILMDSQDLSHVMCEAAPNGDSLLDGLLQVADYCVRIAIGKIDDDNEAAAREYKRKCVAAFGGSKYESFCTSVLGV